jgi:hypothetical protein
MVFNTTFNNISANLAVSFFGGGNRTYVFINIRPDISTSIMRLVILYNYENIVYQHVLSKIAYRD